MTRNGTPIAPVCWRHDESFGQPPTGRFLEMSFFMASFQSPSITNTSGLGPGGLRGFLAFDFDCFVAIRIAIPVSDSAEALPMVRDSAAAFRLNS